MWLGSSTGGVKGNCLYVIVNKSCGALCVECTSDVGSRSFPAVSFQTRKDSWVEFNTSDIRNWRGQHGGVSHLQVLR
jgi:hypothetical protein